MAFKNQVRARNTLVPASGSAVIDLGEFVYNPSVVNFSSGCGAYCVPGSSSITSGSLTTGAFNYVPPKASNTPGQVIFQNLHERYFTVIGDGSAVDILVEGEN